MKKQTLGLLLVVIGMGMAAAFGAQNADPIRLGQIINGRAAVLSQQAAKAKTNYCKVLPQGKRSDQQLKDKCAPVPQKAAPEAIEELGKTYSKERKKAAAAGSLAAQRKKAYCSMVANDALSPQQQSDGCTAVKKSTTAEAIEKLHATWMAAREAVSPLEVASQGKRAIYCDKVIDGKSTETQLKDGCPTGSTGSDEASIATARSAWQEAWKPVPAARKAVVESYAALCNAKVDGRLIAVQRSASCQPAKKSSEAPKIVDARKNWREAADDATEKKKAAAASKTKLCAVAAAELSLTQQKAGCPVVPSKKGGDRVAELRATWLETQKLAGYAAAAKTHAATSVDPGTRMSGWFSVAGLPFMLGLIIMAFGGLLTRRAVKAEALAQGDSETTAKSANAPVDFGDLLRQTAEAVKALHADASAKPAPTQEDMDAVKTSIETIQREKIERLVSARGALIARHGMGSFAEIFGPFSGGERYLNRAWSALVDLYWHETTHSLKLAGDHMDEAIAALDKVLAAA